MCYLSKGGIHGYMGYPPISTTGKHMDIVVMYFSSSLVPGPSPDSTHWKYCIFNLVHDRSSSLVHGALSCSSPLIKQVFRQSLCCCSSFVGFNSKYSMKYIKFYTVTDTFKPAVVRDMRLATPFLSVSQEVYIIKSLSSA